MLGLRAKTWKKLLGAQSDLNENWLNHKRKEINLDEITWYYDQLITTHGLLKHQICNVPYSSGLWNLAG